MKAGDIITNADIKNLGCKYYKYGFWLTTTY